MNALNDLDIDPLQDSAPVRWAFWKRVLALYLDLALVELIGSGLGLAFWQPLADLGDRGLLLGLAIPVIYFGCLNSRLGCGQTLGKRLMQIRLVDRNGFLLQLQPSLLRASLLALILFPFMRLTFYAVSQGQWGPAGQFLPDLLGVMSLYLFLANRQTRQTLHDLVVGTYVIQTTSSTAVRSRRMWPWHGFISLGLGVAIALILLVTNSAAMRLPIEKTLVQTFNLRSVRTAIVTEPVYQTRTLRVILDPYAPRFTADQLATKAAQTVLSQYPDARKFDAMLLTLVQSGYQLGLASAYREFTYRYCPKQGGRLDQRLDTKLVVKTPHIYNVILNADQGYQPIFMKLLLLQTGSDPHDPLSLNYEPVSLGQCQERPPQPQQPGSRK